MRELRPRAERVTPEASTSVVSCGGSTNGTTDKIVQTSPRYKPPQTDSFLGQGVRSGYR